ncbi:hypothetical protein DFQ03_0384 [Maribacter caenipelagi]|uniref:Uncharacterized protein n=1 Tax=Maribacter caenipelagi TaxID=1447781 RepID=A0A4R7DEC5_9FLAO|nr:hypothetical protein [Maribacter caenipelagi]TDS18675.1 hypothetical protein DFQ03_0384 [Maribacter caenipelagi]
MTSDLNSLIDYYQWEIIRIQAQIDENLEMHFYNEIEFDIVALRDLKNELDAILTLQDSRYPKITRVKDRIEYYKTKITEQGKSSDFKDVYEIRIREVEKELEALLHVKNKSISFETQYVDDALYKLYSKEIVAFNLYLIENKQTYLNLNLADTNDIRITVYLENKNDYSWYRKYSLIKDLKLYDLEGGGMYLTRRIYNSNTLLEIKELLSRIVIAIKSVGHVKNEIYLELIENK